MVGVPAPFVVMMQLMPWIWPKMKAVAHTLPYDAAVMTDFKVPTERLASIRIPTLVMHGSKTDARLQKATRTVADAVPGAQLRTLSGQTHNVAPSVLAPAVVEFFTAGPGVTADQADLTAMRFIIMHKTNARLGGRRDPEP